MAPLQGIWDNWAFSFLTSTCIDSTCLGLWEPATVGQYQGQSPVVPKHWQSVTKLGLLDPQNQSVILALPVLACPSSPCQIPEFW